MGKCLEDAGTSLEEVSRTLEDVRRVSDSRTLRALTHPVSIPLIEAAHCWAVR